VRLDRIVAIKVLPAHLSENAQLRQRFEQEARAISSLNHPNICTLHDIHLRQGSGGQAGYDVDVDFMVMEYIEGETLAQRIARGAIPLEEAIEIGLRVADALDKAHRNEIVHRDVKPGNIILTKSGPKLIDFGLAKRRVTGSSESDASAVTEQKPLTEEGAILGTFQYMAPEQVEALDTDARTDIFAFGALLYEMLTGRKAFEGRSQASLINAILSSEPQPIAELRPTTPSRLGRIVRRCLAKDPDDRWQSARDMVLELSSLSDEVDAPSPMAPASRTGERLLWTLALMAVAITGVVLRHSGTADTTRLSVSLPPGHQLLGGSSALGRIASFDISPDGRNIVYAARSSLGRQLYLRRLGDFEAVAIPGTEGASMPFFSPDGERIAYWAGPGLGSLRKISIAGGASTKIFDGNFRNGGSWGPNGTIVFGGPQLSRVPEDGGVLEPIGTTEPNSVFSWPQVLPDGKEVLVTVARRDHDRIVVVSLETGEARTVLEGYGSARYVSSGHLIVHDVPTANLLAVGFDLAKLEAHGAPVPVVENVYASPRGFAQFAVSETGVLAYAPAGQGGNALIWVDREGRASEAWEIERGAYTHPRVSPDGSTLLFLEIQTTGASDSDILILSDGGEPVRFLSSPFRELSPIFSPDGRYIAYVSDESGRSEVYVRPYPAGNQKWAVSTDGGQEPVWSRDGRELFYRSGTKMMVATVRLGSSFEADRPRHLFEATYFTDGAHPRLRRRTGRPTLSHDPGQRRRTHTS